MNNEEIKINKFAIFIFLLLCLVMILIHINSGIMASYSTTIEGTDSVTVAKFNISTTVTSENGKTLDKISLNFPDNETSSELTQLIKLDISNNGTEVPVSHDISISTPTGNPLPDGVTVTVVGEDKTTVIAREGLTNPQQLDGTKDNIMFYNVLENEAGTNKTDTLYIKIHAARAGVLNDYEIGTDAETAQTDEKMIIKVFTEQLGV